LTTVLAFAASVTAFATIDSIASDFCRNPECTATVVQPVARGIGSATRTSTMTIKGPTAGIAVGLSVSGSGVTAAFGNRTLTSIDIRFTVPGSAALGIRTVTINYPIGSDTFTIRVIRGGSITNIQQIVNGSAVAPTNIPVNQPVTLRFTGTSIGNANIARNFDIQSGSQSGGCGGSETMCSFTVTFTRVGTYNIHLIDNSLQSQTTSPLLDFWYAGPDDITVVGQVTTSPIISTPKILTSTSVSTPVIDAAPRGNVTNLVRRINPGSPNFTRDGFSYYRLASPENLCQGMSGTQSRTITVANPTWGVTNTGTTVITVAFQAQLSAGGQTIAATVPANLAVGASTNFTWDRPGDSRLSVFTFLDQLGCFVSPTAVGFFEDPQITVVVDTQNTVAESKETNNTRIY
jgi:hypothetical protein